MTEIELHFAKGQNIIAAVAGLAAGCASVYASGCIIYDFDTYKLRYAIRLRTTWIRELIIWTDGWVAILIFLSAAIYFLCKSYYAIWRVFSSKSAIKANCIGLYLHTSFRCGRRHVPYEQIIILSLGRVKILNFPLLPSLRSPKLINTDVLEMSIGEGGGVTRRVMIAARFIKGSSLALEQLSGFIHREQKACAEKGSARS